MINSTNRYLTIDGLAVIDGLDLIKEGRKYIKELKKGRVTCINACCGFWDNSKELLDKIGLWHRFFHENKDVVYQIRSADDISNVSKDDRVGIILGVQNTSPIEDNLSLISVFNDLGIKVMQLTYNIQNLVGGSCYEEEDSGLTRFGLNVIEEMNRVGMIIDLSHVGDRTSLDAIKASKRPVAVTHSNPYWIYPADRNKTKNVLKVLRDHNGILGLCLYPLLIDGPHTTLEEFIEMVKRTVDFMGPTQVAIGTDKGASRSPDFLNWIRMGRWTHRVDYGAGSKDKPNRPDWPTWFQGPADFPNIIEGFLNAGFDEETVQNILGYNWQRFFKEGFKSEDELEK